MTTSLSRLEHVPLLCRVALELFSASFFDLNWYHAMARYGITTTCEACDVSGKIVCQQRHPFWV